MATLINLKFKLQIVEISSCMTSTSLGFGQPCLSHAALRMSTDSTVMVLEHLMYSNKELR